MNFVASNPTEYEQIQRAEHLGREMAFDDTIERPRRSARATNNNSSNNHNVYLSSEETLRNFLSIDDDGSINPKTMVRMPSLAETCKSNSSSFSSLYEYAATFSNTTTERSSSPTSSSRLDKLSTVPVAPIRRSPSLTFVGCPETYADKRSMTALQEKLNAITMLPPLIYSLWYIWTKQWIRYETDTEPSPSVENDSPLLPPFTVLALFLGAIIHNSCSFLYHWKYASVIKDPIVRLQHWSRRLDPSSIHVAAALSSFATSGGNLLYFGVNLVYNLDCVRYQWHEEINPRRNQIRILLAVLLYAVPIAFYCPQTLVCFVSTLALAFWFFAVYPIGGGSHAVFHFLLWPLAPLLLNFASQLEAMKV